MKESPLSIRAKSPKRNISRKTPFSSVHGNVLRLAMADLPSLQSSRSCSHIRAGGDPVYTFLHSPAPRLSTPWTDEFTSHGFLQQSAGFLSYGIVRIERVSSEANNLLRVLVHLFIYKEASGTPTHHMRLGGNAFRMHQGSAVEHSHCFISLISLFLLWIFCESRKRSQASP